MNKGRKTTREERAEIVAFCIENNKNYTLTVEKYNISYQQIYSGLVKKCAVESIPKIKYFC